MPKMKLFVLMKCKNHRDCWKSLQRVERDTSISYTLAQAKETIWMGILDFMNEIWPSIQIIFKQKELIKKATETIY